MKKSSLVLIIVILFTSCATFQKPCQRIDQVKASSICLEYRDGIYWEEISKTFGEPDVAFCPEPGKPLTVTTRGYEDIIIIFHIKPERYKEDGKLRSREVVYKIEFCKKK